MTPDGRTLAACLTVQIGVSIAGAYLSWRVRAGETHWAWMYLPSLAAATLWLLVARKANSLSNWAIAWDVAVAVAYLATFWWLGERLTAMQWVGAVIALVGVVMMAG